MINAVTNFVRHEKALLASAIALAILMPLEHTLMHSHLGMLFGLIAVFGVVIFAAMSVAHHAEILAIKYGEPYGTLILTLAAVTVEIVIIVIMMSHSHDQTLARDTIYSAVMLDFDGLLGIAAIIGGIKHGEQAYNIDSSNSYVSMILVSVGLAMVLPAFMPEASQHAYQIFTIIMFLFLYVVFTRIQVKEHKYFFQYRYEEEISLTHGEEHDPQTINGLYHGIVMIVLIILIGMQAELLSVFMKETITLAGLPIALAAFTVAVISASPELITAVRSATGDRMQTVVNIALGASLSTVLLTVPAVLIVSMVAGFPINLTLEPVQMLMIGMTVLAGMIHFNDGETNVLEGAVHMALFAAFVALMFVGGH